MFNSQAFAVNTPATFTYKGEHRSGVVIEVAVMWVRMQLDNGQYRTFRYADMRKGNALACR